MSESSQSTGSAEAQTNFVTASGNGRYVSSRSGVLLNNAICYLAYYTNGRCHLILRIVNDMLKAGGNSNLHC
jgi:hypothetical protein